MVNINRATLCGRLTKDPELRYTPNGVGVCNLSLATNSFSTRNGERKESTEFHNVVVYDQGNRRLAQWTAEAASKGAPVFVEGRIQTRSWEGQDGQKRRVTEIIASDCQVLTKRTDAPPVGASAAALDEGLVN